MMRIRNFHRGQQAGSLLQVGLLLLAGTAMAQQPHYAAAPAQYSAGTPPAPAFSNAVSQTQPASRQFLPSTAPAGAGRVATFPAGNPVQAASYYQPQEQSPLNPPQIQTPVPNQPFAPGGGENAGNPLPNFVPEPGRLPLLPGLPSELRDPLRRPALEQEYSQYVQRTIDPEVTLDLIVGRPRILQFRDTPTRIYIAQGSVASYDIISDSEIAVVGLSPGRTVLTLWMNDPARPGQQRVLSYLLRVSQDAGYKVQLEAVYAELEKEINRDFPDSEVKLSLIGDQLIVRGQAKDVIEAAQILQVVLRNAPPGRKQNNGTNLGANISIQQTSYSPQGVLESSEQIGGTLDNLIANAGLDGDANVINLLHIPGEQQVMLRVTVAEVNRSALRSIGANIRVAGSSGIGFDSSFPQRVGDLQNATLMALEGGTLSVLRGDFRLAVDALKQQNLARTLAEPNLVTLHGRPASFQAGGQFPVPAGQVGFGSAAQGVAFVPFGVQLNFIPFIVDRDRIRLTMAANVSTRDDAQTTQVGGSNVPGLTTRNFQNSVELREGQTLAVAGLIQTNFGANSTRVPGLGDLPFIGRLFKNDATTADEQELVILITPELVHPLEPEHCLTLPGSDVYEPGDIEFYLKGNLESRRSYDFRSPVRTDWARLMRYHHCEDRFIVGPTGHTYGCRDQGLPGGHQRSALSPAGTLGPEMLPATGDPVPVPPPVLRGPQP